MEIDDEVEHRLKKALKKKRRKEKQSNGGDHFIEHGIRSLETLI